MILELQEGQTPLVEFEDKGLNMEQGEGKKSNRRIQKQSNK